jgi:hypothetical protein
VSYNAISMSHRVVQRDFHVAPGRTTRFPCHTVSYDAISMSHRVVRRDFHVAPCRTTRFPCRTVSYDSERRSLDWSLFGWRCCAIQRNTKMAFHANANARPLVESLLLHKATKYPAWGIGVPPIQGLILVPTYQFRPLVIRPVSTRTLATTTVVHP